MRLIDADAMKDTNNNVIAVIDPETKSKYWISLNDYINAQPTVPRQKQGWWLTVDTCYFDGEEIADEWQCSKCGYDVDDKGDLTNYCPECGAKMSIDTSGKGRRISRNHTEIRI